LILEEGEVSLDLLVVSCGCVIASLGQEVSQSVKSLNVVLSVRNEARVVGDVFTGLVDVGLVDEVPSTLPRVALTFNYISESRAFNERMASLIHGDIGVVSLERSEHVSSSDVDRRVLNLKEIVGSSGS